MARLVFSSDWFAALQFASAPRHSHVRLRSTASAVALAAAALPWGVGPARAACSPTLNPTTGQTVTCNSNQPNPVTTAIVAQPGSTNVTVNMQSGAQLNVGGGDALVLGGGGQVNNSSGAIIQGVRGVNVTGPATITNSGQISGTGGPGVILNGPGNSTLNNNGQIGGSGGAAVQFNTVAGSTQTFNVSGNGSINGNFVGSGDGQIVIVDGGNFNGGITISGNGINSITTLPGHNINGLVSISGNAQTTIVNGAAYNNGLVINGAGINSITNQAGNFINQIFSVTGSQNTVDNAGTLNNGLTVGNGTNTITNRSGATINQTFSVTGTQNTISNAGTLNNGVTVSGNGNNSITNAPGGVINQVVNVTGNPVSAVTNFGTVNGTIKMSGTGSVYNSGTISGGPAIDFTVSPGAGPFTLTLAPGFSINGNVLGTGSDTFQLGDSLILRGLAGTFNVSNIGPAQQYRGFSTFNKIGTSLWTLTGTGAQNWNISGGVLIGDTNSLQGPAITDNAALVFSQNFAGTYAGSIGGTGAVTVQGGGTVAFTGANTYSGDTTINGATLQLGNGGTSGSIAGDVVNNGTLAINRTDTFTFGNMVSGTGAFVQAGPGTTILTGNSGYSGPTTVAAGTLRVAGSIAGSSGVTVNSGATLGGTGTVTGRVASTTVNDGGTLAPGDNAVGDLVVAGNLVFQNLANYLVQVSPTNASNTFVTGSATLGGTLVANSVGGPYTLNQIFPVVSVVGPLTGTFSGLATTGDFGTATLSLAYGPHEAFLIITVSGAAAPVWKSVPGTSDWNTGTNWDSGLVPTPTDIALFNASTITTIDIRQANTQVGGLQFNAGAPAYTFNVTGTIGVPSSLVIQGNGVADISGNAPTFVVSGVSGALGTLQFNNASSSGDAVIITNAFGQTIFTGNSTGGLARFVTNAGGVVDFSGTTGSAGNNRVAAGSIEGAGSYNLGANSLSVGLNGLSTTVSGSINDGGASGGTGASLVKLGDGTLILSGTNTYTGLTAVLGGMLQLGDGGTSGSILGNVFTHTTFAINRSDTYTFGGRILGDGAFVQMGPGTTILTANSLYLGGTTIGAGTLQLGNGGTSGSIAGDVLNNGTLAFNRSDTMTLAGTITGSGAVNQNGTGTTILAADNTYGGGTTISAGTLQLGDGGASGSLTGNVVNNGTFAVNRSDTYTFGGVISGTGSFAQIGPGTTILTAANTYSGGTAVNGGVLAAAADANLGAATGGLAFDGGTLQFLSGFATNRAVALNAGGGTFDTNGNSAMLAGVISGIGGLTKIGAGTLVLSGANTYSGGTILQQGTLQLANDSALGTGALTTLGSVVSYVPGVTIANPIVFNSNDTQLEVAAGVATQAGAISETGGARPLEKIGTGTLILTGANSYGGGTTISAGTLQLGDGGTSGSLTGNVANNGTLAFNRSDIVTFAGSITGSGALNQIGTGTTILTADNSYGGGTTISAGTLQLGDGGSSGSITGNVANNGTLVFNRSDIVAFGGTISGTGAVAHNGIGATILTGISTYTGPTNVNAGILIVDGSIAASSGLTVATGALVGGTGALPSTTINGTLSPGNSIGTITINGNLVLGAGSIYRVEVAPTAADRTNVTGSATLAGTAQLVFGPGTYASNSYTILSAAGGRSGTFDTVTTEGLPATLSASLSYTATDVLLVTLTSSIAQLAGLTPNQRAVGAAQDTAFNLGLATIPGLNGLTTAQLPAALDQLSGEVHASTAGVLVDESRYMRGAVLGRLRQASYGGNTGMASLSLGGPRAFADGEELSALAYGKSPVVKAPLAAPAATSDVVFWAQGFGAWGRFNGDGNAASVRRDLAGFFTGLDTRVGESGRAGIAAGYTGSRNNLDGRGSANVETGHVAGYGGWSFGALNLRAGGAYAFHAIDTDRTILFPGFADRATARYDGGTGQIFGEVGYGFAFGNVAVEPFAGGAWVRLDTDAAAERATTAGLNIAANSFEVGYSTLGIRAAGLIPIGDGMVLIPRATAAWQHAFDGVTPTAALAFQLAPAVPFVIAGVPIARDSLLAEAGLDLAIGRNATLGVSYIGQIASNVSDHAAKGRFIWRF